MITITNYTSGEILLKNGVAEKKLSREEATRLVMAARMHNVAEFIEKLPTLIADFHLVESIQNSFENKDSSTRWGIKEKFARLRTLSKSYEPKEALTVVETVSL